MSKQELTFAEFKKSYPGVPSSVFTNGNTVIGDSLVGRYSSQELKKNKKYVKKKERVVKVAGGSVVGRVVIVLKGQMGGERMVCVKELKEGFVALLGLKRNLVAVEKKFVQVTSTEVDLSGMNVGEVSFALLRPGKKLWKKHAVRDKFLKDKSVTMENFKGKEHNKEIQAAVEKKNELSKKLQADLLKVVKKTKFMEEYLSTKFSLQDGQYPHLMKF